MMTKNRPCLDIDVTAAAVVASGAATLLLLL